MNAKNLMKRAPHKWERIVDKMTTTERNDARIELQGIAERAAMLAGYLDERHGHGCGDQGHNKGVKNAMRSARLVHIKAFGYYAFHEFWF